MKYQTSWLGCSIIALSAFAPLAVALPVPAYKVDDSFNKQSLSASPVSIAVTPQNQIHVLLNNGTVATYDLTGKSTGEFASKMDPPPTSMAVADGKIYLLATQSKATQVEFQGKKITRSVASGANCAVFTLSGTKEAEFPLADVSSARDAHFVGDKLAVGDYQQSQIAFFSIAGDKATLAKKIEKEFRLCCGIFDFCPTSDGESIFVANLGAYKVQTNSTNSTSLWSSPISSR